MVGWGTVSTRPSLCLDGGCSLNIDRRGQQVMSHPALDFHRCRIKLKVIEAPLVEPSAHTRLDDGLEVVGCVDGTKQALARIQIWYLGKRSLFVLAQTLHHIRCSEVWRNPVIPVSAAVIHSSAQRDKVLWLTG